MSSKNVVITAPSGDQFLVPEGTLPEEAHKGIPLAVDLSFLSNGVYLEKALRDALARRGLNNAEDFEQPGAYDKTADALREVIKVKANEIVDTIRTVNHE